MKASKRAALALTVFAMCSVAMAGTFARADVSVAITSPGDGDHVYNSAIAGAANQVLTAGGVTTLENVVVAGTSAGAVSISVDFSSHGVVKRGDHVGAATLNADGTWSFDPGMLLPDTYTVTATATDATGATSTDSIQIAVIA